MLPECIDRPFKCLYEVLLDVTIGSYQGVLTDLSSVCIDRYWVLLWNVTWVYWPTYWGITGGLNRVLPGALTDLSSVCIELLPGPIDWLSGVLLGDLLGVLLKAWMGCCDRFFEYLYWGWLGPVSNETRDWLGPVSNETRGWLGPVSNETVGSVTAQQNITKTTAPRIPAWSPTVVLTRRHSG